MYAGQHRYLWLRAVNMVREAVLKGMSFLKRMNCAMRPEKVLQKALCMVVSSSAIVTCILKHISLQNKPCSMVEITTVVLWKLQESGNASLLLFTLK